MNSIRKNLGSFGYLERMPKLMWLLKGSEEEQRVIPQKEDFEEKISK